LTNAREEVNLAEHAEAMARAAHPGWAATAWDGLQQSLELLDEKRIKVVINGGSLNPQGLAEKTLELVCLKMFSSI
jgi:urease alpha subunit